ncbi:SDR family oxidoreductase [Novosphingobium mathurense]|uniref:3alpha(Or 20beta)-hydroxysteroid dehydrogenase/3(Or 17)beta-hydroxysteroid dehydrogenase n=1 Tax=Novosphingobium mathurense TaxID=428990 RepID=A0A1U6HL04_9SPHN|nr:SDR family oxidoreductase [Novosphingobium mathurense]SLJ96433.1 3alpha(or 20beta)-hydroxysteroid dehydrogenase/3(or 17)beta-hydroxysteroid dehydrogenase [Novosphingobium mathurense]
MGRLQDKVALVTGGASGIGEAMVRRFVAEGARVWLADLDDEAGERIAGEAGATFVRLDVASEAGWGEAMDRVLGRDGRLEVLCNNAGIVLNKPIDQTDLTGWERTMAVNVTGPMLGCRAAIAAMRGLPEGRCGSIVNTASTTSLLGLAFDAAYTTSKHAVVGLTRSIAAWCAQEKLPIRCNTLHPGTTLTAILSGHIAAAPELKDVFDGMSPMGRMADPAEIANLALFLASDESSYCTGSMFVADGGLTATHPAM